MANTIVNTNISALNAHRQILSVGGRQSRAAERLSSGMRINRAADDAAGLAISEGMRNQITGLNQSVRNSYDGISLAQTAEGALEEIHRMGERIRQLTVQAANDTYDTNDRMLIELEVEQLVQDVNRIISDTEFNGMNVLAGEQGSVGEGIRQTAKSTFVQARGVFEIAQDSYLLSTSAARSVFDGSMAVAQVQHLAEIAIAEAFSGIANSLAAQFQADVNSVMNMVHSEIINAGNDWMGGDDTGMNTLGLHISLADNDELEAIAERWDIAAGFGTDLANLIPGFVYSMQTELQARMDGLRDAAYALDDIVIANEDPAARASWDFDFSNVDDFTALAEARDAIAGFANEMMFGVESTGSASNLFTQNAFRALADGLRAIGQSAAQDIFSVAIEHAAEYRQEDIVTAGRLHGLAANTANAELQRDTAEERLVFEAATNTFNSAREAHGITLRGVAELSAQNFGIQSGANSAQRINMQLNNIQVYADLLEANVMIPVTGGAEISDTLDILDDFITNISEQRANLGAYHNRLEHTISSLEITSENLSAANSRIRDTDMAAEMMQFTQANVLQQAGMSMLAQANQAPNEVLQLIQ